MKLVNRMILIIGGVFLLITGVIFLIGGFDTMPHILWIVFIINLVLLIISVVIYFVVGSIWYIKHIGVKKLLLKYLIRAAAMLGVYAIVCYVMSKSISFNGFIIGVLFTLYMLLIQDGYYKYKK